MGYVKNYLTEIWSDLSQRSKENIKGIEKLTFGKYYDLPGIILERLFVVFDKDKDGALSYQEFIGGMKTIFYRGETFDNLAKFIFDFYNFEGKKTITRENVRVVLSYVPLQNISSLYGDFKDRIQSQNQLFDILQTAFKDKNELTYDEYINVITNVNSDIFILILMFLLEKRPFTNETIDFFRQNPGASLDKFVSRTPQIMAQVIASPSLNNKFVSPTLKRRTLAQNKNKAKNILLLYGGGPAQKDPVKKSGFGKEAEKLADKKGEATEKEKKREEKKEKNKPKRRGMMNLKNIEDKSPVISNFAFSKHKDNDDEKEKKEENEKTKEEEDNFGFEDGEKPLIRYEGYIYKLSGSKKLKRVYFKLVGKDIYYFKNKDEVNHKGMHNLSGVFVKKGDDATIDGKKYYTISILYPQKDRTYYFEDEDLCKTWLEKFKLAIEHKSLLDDYEIKEKIGRGKFGLVKYGINKKTKEPVAIKIMAKKNMDSSDFELARTEIDILKVSQHPNIIKLFDVYETADYIYIVMEYCSGGDLFSYIESTDYKLPEPRACEIIHELSMAIYYIHSYGIVHRDLKPENILMTDDTPNAHIRLLDFGLSKIIGNDEKCKEPYGTLSFVAPEVLRGKPYDKSVDLWSIGITTFLLLCGYLPFDDKHSEREIARQTINEPVPYSDKIWDKLSPEAKDFVDGLLKKNPEERLKIKQVLEHPWIKKFISIPVTRNYSQIKYGNEFEAYTSK